MFALHPIQCDIPCDLRVSDAGHARITHARGGCILHVRRCGHTAAARPDEKGRLWSVCLACMFAVENLRRVNALRREQSRAGTAGVEATYDSAPRHAVDPGDILTESLLACSEVFPCEGMSDHE